MHNFIRSDRYFCESIAALVNAEKRVISMPLPDSIEKRTNGERDVERTRTQFKIVYSYHFITMNTLVLLLVFSIGVCTADQLLGGWKVSDDEALKEECLKKALVKIHGAKVGDDVQSHVSDHVCATQVVNGLNIKCTFTLREQDYRCSFYKPFSEPYETQVKECKQLESDSNEGNIVHHEG